MDLGSGRKRLRRESEPGVYSRARRIAKAVTTRGSSLPLGGTESFLPRLATAISKRFGGPSRGRWKRRLERKDGGRRTLGGLHCRRRCNREHCRAVEAMGLHAEAAALHYDQSLRSGKARLGGR